MTRSLWSIGEDDVAPTQAGPAPRIVRVLEVDVTEALLQKALRAKRV
jgi:hypothetical protein